MTEEEQLPMTNSYTDHSELNWRNPKEKELNVDFSTEADRAEPLDLWRLWAGKVTRCAGKGIDANR